MVYFKVSTMFRAKYQGGQTNGKTTNTNKHNMSLHLSKLYITGENFINLIVSV